MGFPEAIKVGFQKYVVFKGRAIRSEYWYWVLFVFIVSVVTSVLDLGMFPDVEWSPLNTATSVAFFLPGIAVSVRRLHDVGRSGWWLLLIFTIIGIIPLFYWSVIQGEATGNRFGPNPLSQSPG